MRVKDILSELEKQVGPLEQQSKKAKEFLALKEQLKMQEISLFRMDYDSLHKEIEEIAQNISNTSGELEDAKKEKEESKSRYESIEQEIEDFDKNIEKKKEKVKGVSAKVITVSMLGGDCYPATPIGINLPNADWIRRDHGSKSVTIENITEAYDKASQGNGFSEEFVWSDVERNGMRQYGFLTDNLHTDLHECLGHGSGKLLENTDPDALKAYSSTLEETRADLFGLYYLADPKLVELGLLPDGEAYKSEYYKYIMNGLMTQLVRIELGKNVEEAHMRNRQLIAKWAYEKGKEANVIELKKRNGKTYVVVNDYPRLRELFGTLLAEIQRIKSEGDYAAGKNLVEAGMVEDDIRIEGMKVSFSLIFEKPTDPFMKSVVKAAETAILTHVGKEVEIVDNISVKTVQAARPEVGKLLPQVKNIIGISSGKGGVGKSTVAANLAVALAKLGYKVGLLDADIFGPSMPKMFQVEDARPYAEKIDGRDMIIPVEKYGVKLLSIGFFVDPDQATLWRGGMASNALKQLIGDAAWGELDYFLIDLPPGTSDIHLTVVQTLAMTGAVVVSTPQAVALADARKGINMFTNDKVNVPILGLVENMAWFTPAELPDNKYYIFGREGAKKLAEEMNVPLLGQIPIVQSICENGDKGTPVALDENTMTGRAFLSLAAAVVRQVDRRNVEKAPTQIVEMHK